MEHDILFSVIVPTYNRANLIQKTLNSVFDQSFNNYEIIVVDNGSTDNTLELLAPLEKEGKIKIIRNPINEERSLSRNLGMQAAKGRFLTLLDSDDLMYRDGLKDAYEFTQLNPEIDFFHNLYHLIDTNGNVIYQYRFPPYNNTIKSIANGNFLSCIGVFMSRLIYTNYKFETNPIIIGSEDWELWIRILAKHKLGRINKINSGIVHHSGRSITTYSLESIITRKKFIINQIKNDKELYIAYKNYIVNINSSSLLFAASMANSGGMYKEARMYLKVAFQSQFFLIFDRKFLRILQISFFKIKNKHNI
jgi:glycosyltransferase involved in cell wall biosynthesis